MNPVYKGLRIAVLEARSGSALPETADSSRTIVSLRARHNQIAFDVKQTSTGH